MEVYGLLEHLLGWYWYCDWPLAWVHPWKSGHPGVMVCIHQCYALVIRLFSDTKLLDVNIVNPFKLMKDNWTFYVFLEDNTAIINPRICQLAFRVLYLIRLSIVLLWINFYPIIIGRLNRGMRLAINPNDDWGRNIVIEGNIYCWGFWGFSSFGKGCIIGQEVGSFFINKKVEVGLFVDALNCYPNLFSLMINLYRPNIIG